MKLTANDKKLKSQIIRFLMVDNQQITFNTIVEKLEQQLDSIQGKLLDDLSGFEKMLNLQWDVIIFHAAYDFNVEQALQILQTKEKSTPIILLSDIDAKSEKGLNLLQLGVFEIISLTSLDHLAIHLQRAATLSRLIRREQQLSLELDKLQQQTQTLVETTEYAVAIFQEGVHASSNAQYAAMFGIEDHEELVGLPILDILQPQDTQEFKQFFKRVSKGDFNNPILKIDSLNPDSKDKTLTLQFSATKYDDEPALQLVIITEADTQTSTQTVKVAGFASQQEIYEHLNFAFAQSAKLGLILYSMQQLPSEVLVQDWNSSRSYFNALEHKLAAFTRHDVLRISEAVYLTTQPTTDQTVLQQTLAQIATKLPTQLEALQQTYPVQIQLSATLLEQLPNIEQIDDILHRAFVQQVDAKVSTQTTIATPSPKLSMGDFTNEPIVADISFGEKLPQHSEQEHLLAHNVITDDVQRSLAEQLENNAIQLQFQQLYDKEDIDTHIYEVSASFIHDKQPIALETFAGLKTNPELAVKVDRWVLVEASKRLHQFLSTCPKARIIVPLHAASLQDSSLTSLLSKLVNLINSKYTRPLMLQLNEQDVLTNLDHAAKFLQIVQEQNIGITIADFGRSMYCVNILQQLKIKFAKLTPDFTALLQNDDGLVELQEKITGYKEHNEDVLFLLSELNDMNAFANAWNVDTRYLQGNYYQAKQADFVNHAG